SSAAVDVALAAPSLICCSPPVGLELDRAVWKRDTGEDTRPVGDHVVCSDRHALTEHRTTCDPGVRADLTASCNDAVAQCAALADRRPAEDHRAFDRRSGGNR